MTMKDLLLTLVSTALISNFVLQMPLAVDPVLASSTDSRKRVHALGIATTLLMVLSSLSGYLLYHYLLQPLALVGIAQSRLLQRLQRRLTTLQFALFTAQLVEFSGQLAVVAPTLFNLLLQVGLARLELLATHLRLG